MNKEKTENSSDCLSGENAYTQDTFKCGICKETQFSIDDYVVHMLEEEKCVMILEQSSSLKDLFLPKFKQKEVLLEESTPDFNPSFAVEVEVGRGIRRWKCKVCSLTFSRQAAVLNHYKLAQHPLPGVHASLEAALPLNIKWERKEPSNPSLEILASNDLRTTDVKDDDLKKLPLNDTQITSSQPTCGICGQIFKSESIVSSHMKIVHSEERAFVCKMDGCNLSFKTKGSLVRHGRRHTDERPFKCLRCGRSYRESGSLLRHQQSKLPCNQKPDSHLPRYGITLPFSPAVKVDLEGENKIPLKKERCEDVEEFSPPVPDNDEAEETKAKIRKEILANNQCKQYEDLKQENVSVATLLEKKPFLKDMKKETLSFDSDDPNDSNRMDHHGVSDDGLESNNILRRCFMCPICYKSYAKITFLTTHVKKHIAELGKECSECEKRFSSDFALSRHLVTHSTARQFECQLCGKTFKLKSHALAHLKSHSDLKSVPCPECGRLFKTVSSRNTHLKIHKGDKDFECSFCFKKFLVKASFLRHLRVHTQDRPFHCPHCNRAFKEQGTLKRHIRLKAPCSDLSLASSGPKLKVEDLIYKTTLGESATEEDRHQELLDLKDSLSETDADLDSCFTENRDSSSIYSDLSFSPEDYLLSPFNELEPMPLDDNYVH